MANFTAQIRRDYRDISGLVLDLRAGDLISEEGTHDGGDSAAVLSDSTAGWAVDEHVGKVVQNITDGSYGVVTANTATTVTAALTGGTDDDWDSGDAYAIQADADGVLRWPNRAPARRIDKDEYHGAHDGGDGSATLEDSTAPWTGMDLVGMAVANVTDGSTGWITANDDDSVTATLQGGTDNDWDDDDVYAIFEPRFGDSRQATPANQPLVRTVSGRKVMQFDAARSHRMELVAGNIRLPYPEAWWAAAVEKWNDTSALSYQVILSLSADGVTDGVSLWRKYSGNYAVVHGDGYVVGSRVWS